MDFDPKILACLPDLQTVLIIECLKTCRQKQYLPFKLTMLVIKSESFSEFPSHLLFVLLDEKLGSQLDELRKLKFAGSVFVDFTNDFLKCKQRIINYRNIKFFAKEFYQESISPTFEEQLVRLFPCAKKSTNLNYKYRKAGHRILVKMTPVGQGSTAPPFPTIRWPPMIFEDVLLRKYQKVPKPYESLNPALYERLILQSVSEIVAITKWRMRAGKHKPTPGKCMLSQDDLLGPWILVNLVVLTKLKKREKIVVRYFFVWRPQFPVWAVLTSRVPRDTWSPIILRIVFTFSTVRAPDRSESNWSKVLFNVVSCGKQAELAIKFPNLRIKQ